MSLHKPHAESGGISTSNASSTLLTAASVYTGTWEDVSNYESVTIAVKTYQNGTYSVQFSPDGTNQDSTLTRYYRTTQIEPPHRFTIAREFMRVVFTNTSASDQTYFRLQVMLGDKAALNVPLDAIISQDYDATVVRPTDFKYEVALGRRQGSTTWNKFGYNDDVDSAGAEIVAAFGGTFTPLYTASTLRFVSSSTADDDGDTGANSVVVWGVDASRNAQIEVVTLNGTTNVDTTTTWLGVNRVSINLAGSGKANAGLITCTAITGGTTQATIPIGEGSSQQLIFFTSADHQALLDYLLLKANKLSGSNPTVTFKVFVYSDVSNAVYEVFRYRMDTSVENHMELDLKQPLIIGEKSAIWITATTTADNTLVSGRFSLIEFRDVDA